MPTSLEAHGMSSASVENQSPSRLTMPRLYCLILGLIRTRICALSRELSSPKFSFVNSLVKAFMPLLLSGSMGEQVVSRIFSLILLQFRIIVLNNQWTVTSMLLGSRLLIACRRLIMQLAWPVSDFDVQARELVKLWSYSFSPRVFPRPSMPACHINLAEVGDIMCEWQGVTSLIAGDIPQSDHVCKVNWLRMSGTFVSFLHDSFVTGISGMLETFYLERNPTRLLQRMMTVSWEINIRAILRSYCTRVTLLAAAPCVLLQAKNELQMLKLIEFLRQDPDYCCTYVDEQVVEFTSKSLLTILSRYSRFLHFACDRRNEFSADFVLTCYTSLGKQLGQQSLGLERAYKLPNAVNQVVLSSRNSLSCRHLAAELQFRHGLVLLDDSVSPQACLNAFEINAQDLISAANSFSHIWTFFQLDREGAWDLSPRITSAFASFYVDTAMQGLLSPKCSPTYAKRFTWRGTFRLLHWWMKRLCSFYRQGRIHLIALRCLPLLSHIQHAILNCPFPETFSPELLDQNLTELLWCLLDARNDPQHHYEHDLKCAVLCIEGCRAFLGVAPPDAVPVNRPLSGVVISELIGTGTFGAVYKAYDYGLNRVVALKEVDLDFGPLNRAAVEEVNNLRCLHHQNIVLFYNASIVDNKLCITTEYCSGGSLHQVIPQLILLKVDEANMTFRKVAVQLLLGLCFLHGNAVIHGDLKPANILMDTFDRIKLADFGTMRSLRQTTGAADRRKGHVSMGTAEYMAPETILDGQLTAKSDVWSLGCTLYHMVTGRAPWKGYVKPWGILKSLNEKSVFNLEALVEAAVDENAKALIRSCLRLNPTARPSSLELLLSPFLYEEIGCLWTTIDPLWCLPKLNQR